VKELKMKKALIATTMATLLSASAQADVVGVYIGGHVWDNEVKGVFGEKSDNLLDLGLEDQQQSSFYIAFEHPLPLIPNVKVAKTTLDTDGSTSLTGDFTFGGIDFSEGTAVKSDFKVNYIDYTLYYELFDNDLITFDFGITARDVDAVVNVNAAEGALTGDVNASAIIPMLYASTIVGLPFTGFNVFAQGNFLSIDDSTLYDYQAGVSYELVDNLAVDINLTVGYRAVKLELDDLDDLYADLDFKGVFVGTEIHF